MYCVSLSHKALPAITGFLPHVALKQLPGIMKMSPSVFPSLSLQRIQGSESLGGAGAEIFQWKGVKTMAKLKLKEASPGEPPPPHYHISGNSGFL